MKVLLVGGAGYIGTALCEHLKTQGFNDISVLDTFWFGDNLPPEVSGINKNVKDTTENDYRGYDTVVYFAGLSNDPMSEFMPMQCFIDNGAMPAYVASLCKKVGVPHFIYASTCSVYGWSPDGRKLPDDPVKVNYPYGLSKYQGEAGVMALAGEFFTVTAIRMGTVCGYSPRMRFDLILNVLYKNIVANKKFTLSNPSIHRPILGIKDAVRTYEQFICYPESGIFNAVSFNATLGEIGQKVISWFRENFDFIPEVDVNYVGDLRNYVAQNTVPIEMQESICSILDGIHKEFDGEPLSTASYYNQKVFEELVKKGEYR